MPKVFRFSRGLCACPALFLILTSSAAPARLQTLSGITLAVDPDGSFSVASREPAFAFGGTVGVPVAGIVLGVGKDGAGEYHKISFNYSTVSGPVASSIRAYYHRPIVIFSTTLLSAAANGPLFPTISKFPQGMYRFAFQFTYLYQYGPWSVGPDSPWSFFDASGNTFIVSPASHFPIAATTQSADNFIVAGINSAIPALPAGFTQETMLALGKGINHTWDTWGRAMTDLQGKLRPAADSDISLAALGYWTDSVSKYYYNYVQSMGYEGTLLGVKQDFAKQGIPIGSMQLDSWWYPKGNPPLWSNSGDALDKGQYLLRPDPAIIPDGLGGFQKLLGGTPLLVHARWTDPSSPVRQQYQMSGNVPVDPNYWTDLATYLSGNGVMTYEQDWLASLAQPNMNVTDPEAYLDNMAHAMAVAGITMQYCGQYVGQLMQGSKYNNLTSARVSPDGFNSSHWDPFLYNSRLTSSLGIFPFADNVYSTDIKSLVLETNSAGIVAIADGIGNEVAANLLQMIRPDGIVIKPDAPMVPMDSTFIADAQAELVQGPMPPMVAYSSSNRGGAKISYVFAYSRAADGSSAAIRFAPADLGIAGSAYVYNYFSHQGQLDSLELDLRRFRRSHGFLLHRRTGRLFGTGSARRHRKICFRRPAENRTHRGLRSPHHLDSICRRRSQHVYSRLLAYSAYSDGQ